MQLWLKCSIAVSFAVMATGCASPEDKVVNEDHRYVNAGERGPLLLPQGAQMPQGSGEYVLPEVKTAGDIGETLDIHSPPQLFALASGSRLDSDNITNKIWFDRTNVVDDLPMFTYNAMLDYLSLNKVEGSEFDQQRKTVKTGWISHEREGGFWLWSDGGKTLSYRFETKQSATKKGLTTTVEVKLIGHKVDDNEVPLSSLSPAFISRAEVSFLNDYIFHFQLMQEDLMRQAKIKGANDFTLAMAQNSAGQWGFHSQKSADEVWSSITTLLEELDFKVDDVNRSNKTLYVTFEPDKGFWSSLWSDNDAFEVTLNPGQYIIKVESDAQRQSNILFFDKDEKPLEHNQIRAMEDAFIKMGQGLDLKL